MPCASALSEMEVIHAKCRIVRRNIGLTLRDTTATEFMLELFCSGGNENESA